MRYAVFPAFIAALFCFSCGNIDNHTSEATTISSIEKDPYRHPEWSVNATIYEVNVRQHTPEGTFKALEADLPRIRKMGIDIIWLMPIHPIGELNRKGFLGSYYSIKDYRGVNPEFGSFSDFKSLVKVAHELGMKVILDWVGNHTAWDHPWISSHPDWYTRDSLGNVVPPVTDWSDVADLNFEKADMRHEMIESMKFWVREADIDGYRCDVAGMVPTDFWESARLSLDSLKRVFMLAEAEQADHHRLAFDMSYSWEFLHIMNSIALGEMKHDTIPHFLAKQDTVFPPDAFRMKFITNHDENSWNGTEFDRFGDAHQLYATLAFTIGGMPLVYSGQEAGNRKALRFFEKDTIQWGNYEFQDFYSRLLHLFRENPALWNGARGGTFKRLNTENPEIFAYTRQKENREVIVLLNFSSEMQKVRLREAVSGELKSIFNEQILSVFSAGDLSLGPYGFQVFSR
jgi:glycosidase